MSLRVAIVVGEPSGDNLGAALVRALKQHDPLIEVEGVTGPRLVEAGATQLHSMETLSVMGFIEPLFRLRELLKLKKWLVNYFLSDPPDVFIGIDAPDFNLRLEKDLKKAGIPVVHYVSPSIWAWRSSRIKTIKQAVDLMLTILPFENRIYEEHDVAVKFVGHPATNKIKLLTKTERESEQIDAKVKLGFTGGEQVIGLLPGSRNSELKHMAPLYLQTAKLLFEQNSKLRFTMPLLSVDYGHYLEELQAKLAPDVPIRYVIGDSYLAMRACDVALVTSGTATLEVLLHQKPMLIAYKTNLLTYLIAKALIKVKYIGLPNLLADSLVSEEIIQNEAKPEYLAKQLERLLNDEQKQALQINEFEKQHKVLSQNADVVALEAIYELLGKQYDHSRSG